MLRENIMEPVKMELLRDYVNEQKFFNPDVLMQ